MGTRRLANGSRAWRPSSKRRWPRAAHDPTPGATLGDRRPHDGPTDLSGPFKLDQGRIRLGDAVFVYLERTIAPSAPLPPDVAPRAYGLSPAAVPPSGPVVAAVASGEAVWLGFQAVDASRPATLRVRLDRAEPLDAVTGERWDDALSNEPRNYLVTPPDSRLTGLRIPMPPGYVPFRAGDDLTVRVEGDMPASVDVQLVPPDTFRELTGIIAKPLDPDAAYKGWRLP